MASSSRREFLASLASTLASCAARRAAVRPAPAPRAIPIVYDERGGLFGDSRSKRTAG